MTETPTDSVPGQPARVPFLQSPDRFHEQASHAPVADPINTAQLLIAAGTKFPGTTTNVTADLFSGSFGGCPGSLHDSDRERS